jgi:hypothetical protein
MSDANAHIAGWEAAGLIDRATADRLRAAEAGTPHDPGSETAPTTAAGQPRSSVAALFGPGVTIAEVFAYLGGAFLLAAWSSFMARANGPTSEPQLAIGTMALIAAAVLAALGVRLGRGDERASRAAGVAFLLVASYVGIAAAAFADLAGLDWPASGVVASGVALAVAVLLRIVHPSVLTQVGVLGWVTGLAASTLAWLQVTIFPENISPETGLSTTSGPDPILLVLASAAWWLVTAVIIALIGLREARAAERGADHGAGRRAAVSRFWAGLVAVAGMAMAVTRSAASANGAYGRVLEPWMGDLALLVLAAVLVERAFRRDATSFIYAAALALVVALTDFNVSYLSGSPEVALLVEGLILLGVGVAADRLRRRVGRPGEEPPPRPSPDLSIGETV